jgi:hypothetical protein
MSKENSRGITHGSQNNPDHYSAPRRVKNRHALSREVVTVKTIYENTEQIVLSVTEDKLLLCLQEHERRNEHKNGWVAPAGMLITILIALVTSSFRDFIVSGAVWHALFLLATVVCFAWLVRALLRARQLSTIAEVVLQLKENAELRRALGLSLEAKTGNNGLPARMLESDEQTDSVM